MRGVGIGMWGAVVGMLGGGCGDAGTPAGGHDAMAPDTVEDVADADVAPDTEVAATDADAVADTDADAVADTDADAVADAASPWPEPGFGVITGACHFVAPELADAASSYFLNRIDFADDGYVEADEDQLTPGGQRMAETPNAGGSSLLSEVFAYEVLARCDDAVLDETETEVHYDGDGKKTDMLVTIAGEKVGVSVTRAVGFPFDDPYTVEQAKTLLDKKLGDILLSTGHVSAADKWVKQILSILAYSDANAASIEAAYAEVDPAVRADTIVIVTVTDGDDAFIY